MKADVSARMALRSATAPDHVRVDDTFSAIDLGDPASYGRFLCAQAAAHLPVEEALATGGIATIVPDWPKRRRSDLLRADLAALQLDLPAAIGRPVFDSEAALLGALYVLEGSRLGGTMLRRLVKPGLPSAFLGGADSAAWRNLLVLLDARLNNDIRRDVAIATAKRVFALFADAGRQHLGLKFIV